MVYKLHMNICSAFFLNGSLNKADENALGNWMVGYSVLGAGFVIPIPLINNISLSNKKVKIFTTSGWQECTQCHLASLA